MRKLLLLLFLAFFCRTACVVGQPFSPSGPSRKIALTFDACMTDGMAKKVETGLEKPLFNAAIIHFLRQEKIHATLFISGLWAERYPEIVKELAADSLFEIGNHSYNHRGFTGNCYGLPAMTEGEKQADIRKSQEVLTRLTGKAPRLFRFPGGCFEQPDLELLKLYKLKMVGWTYASGDAFNSDTAAIVQQVLQKARSGAVVVFHLAGSRYAPKTAEVIQVIVPELRKRGYRFVTVSEI